MAQLTWICDHLADIESDMSAFHRVDDIRAMPARRFFPLAWRLPAYRGVMRERVMAGQREQEPPPPQYGGPVYASQPDRTVVPGTKEALMSEPAFQGLFSFGTTAPQPDLREAAQQEYPELRPAHE